MDDVRIVLNPRAIEDVASDPEVGRMLLERAEPIVDAARSGAPRATGAGASSIHAEIAESVRPIEVRVSWDREHYYMGFHEFGTIYLPARPFLAPGVN